MNTIKEQIDLDEILPILNEVIHSGGEFRIYPHGRSMLPTIREGRDSVLLVKADELFKGDMVLYRRDSGVFVLHRIVRMKKNGVMTMRGDNQYFNETPVYPSQIIAKVKGYFKDDVYCSCASPAYRSYVTRRKISFPFRSFVFFIGYAFKKVFRHHGT